MNNNYKISHEIVVFVIWTYSVGLLYNNKISLEILQSTNMEKKLNAQMPQDISE